MGIDDRNGEKGRRFNQNRPVATPKPAAPPAPPAPTGAVDYVAVQKQAEAQVAASNAQIALMQQQGAQQEQQFNKLLELERQRSATLEAAQAKQATLFEQLKTEQEAALKLQQQRQQRAQVMAQQQQVGLFRLSDRTSRTNTARQEVRTRQYGANANVFRR